jgi:hypothetical protein
MSVPGIDVTQAPAGIEPLARVGRADDGLDRLLSIHAGCRATGDRARRAMTDGDAAACGEELGRGPDD